MLYVALGPCSSSTDIVDESANLDFELGCILSYILPRSVPSALVEESIIVHILY